MITRLDFRWLLAGALVTGLTGGALWPQPPTPAVSDHEAAWSLPPVSDLQRHVVQDYTVASRGMPWKANDRTNAPETAAIRWRLAGIITDKVPLILVMTPEQPGTALRVHLGESLPDDSVLDSIENDHAMVRRGECITTWHLFHPQPIATSDACHAADESQLEGAFP